MKMSSEWLTDNKLRETKTGWEGPRWRLTSEQKKEKPNE